MARRARGSDGRLRALGVRVAAALAVALAALVLALALLTRTDRFNEWLRVQVESRVEVAPGCTFRIERVRGWVLRDLTLEGLALGCGDAPIARIRALRIAPRLSALLTGTLRVAHVEVREPWLALERDAAGQWNVLRALAVEPAEPEPAEAEEEGGGLPLPLRIETIRVSDGSVALALDGRAIDVDGLALDASLRMEDEDLRLRLRSLALRVAADDLPVLRAELRGTYEVADGAARVEVDPLRLRTEHSQLRLAGELRPGERVALELRVDPLAVSDLSRFGVPLVQPVTGSARLAGPWRAAALDAELEAGGAELAAELTLDLAEPDPHGVRGTLRLADADLHELLARPDLAGVVDLVATLDDGRIGLRGELVAGDGSARVDAELSGLADTPEYRLELALSRLDPARVLPEQPRLAGSLSLDAQLEGRGVDPESLEASSSLALRSSRLGGVALREGSARLHASAGTLDVERLVLEAEGARLRVEGRAGLRPDAPLALRATAEAADVAPLLALAGVEGGGDLALRVEVGGTLSQASVAARAELGALHVEALRAGSGTVQADLEGLGGPAPAGVLRLQLAGVDAPVALASLTAALRLRGGEPQQLTLDAEAEGADGAAHELALDAEIGAEEIRVVLREIDVELLPFGRWQLAERAELALRGGSLRTEGVQLHSDGSSLALRGTLGTSGAQRFHAVVEALPLSALFALLGQDLPGEGSLGLEVDIAGTASEPSLEASLRVEDLVLADTPLAGLVATLDYRARQAQLDLTLRQDAAHQLRAQGSLPFELAWAEGVAARPLGEMALRAQSEGIALDFLNAFTGAFARDIRGELALDVEVSGPLAQPVPRGELRLRDAAVTPIALNVPVEDIAAHLDFRPGRVRVASLRASAGEGRLAADGALALGAAGLQGVELAVVLEDWPLIDTRRYRMRVDADLRAQGALPAVAVRGDVAVLEGTLRPDLAFLREEPPPRDPTIVRSGAPEAGESEREAEAAAEPDAPLFVYDALALDVDVSIDRNLWVQHDQASIELSGALDVDKAAGEDLALVGRVETVRGWAELQGRRFRLVEGLVLFTGGAEIDPALDVRGRYRVPSYTIDAVIGGTLRDPSLRLESEPWLEQADILAVLLFGRPVSELGEGEQATLGESAADIATRYGVTTVGRSVAEALGLGAAGIQIDELSTERARVGTYLTERTFVSVEQEFGIEAGRSIILEYEFWPGWTLVTSTDSAGASAIGLRWKRRY